MYFFSFEVGQELSTQGPCVCPFCWEAAYPPRWQPQQHMHLEGLWCFWASNFSEIRFLLQRGTTPVGKVTLLTRRCGIVASCKMQKLESVNV